MSWWWPFGKNEEQPVQQGNVAANAPSDMSVPVKKESQVPSAQELLEQDKELDQLSSEAGLTPAAKPKAKKKKAKAKKAVKKKAVKKAKKKK